MTRLCSTCLGILAALLLGLSASSVAAQSSEPADDGEDEAKLSQCLEAVGKAESDPRACIGVVADPCLEQPNESGSDSMVACIARESRLWEEMLLDRFDRLVGQVDDPARVKLREVQDAWVVYRDMRCGLGEPLFAGESVAEVWTAECMLQELGRRAIEISALLEEVSAR